MHPTDWQEVRLLNDTAGQYFGGGPFQGQYGSGQNLASSGQITGAIDTMWNKAIYVTAGIGSGTALVGTHAPHRSTTAAVCASRLQIRMRRVPDRRSGH